MKYNEIDGKVPTSDNVIGESKVTIVVDQVSGEVLKQPTSETMGDEEPLRNPAELEEERVKLFVAECMIARELRIEEMERTFDELAAIVDKCNTASYDLGVIAGRQMSTTSAEFVVKHFEKGIMEYVDEQIGILPDPDLKKKKAKPEEVAMVRNLLETFLDENMDVIVPEVEEVEEEEPPLPDITLVYAVPGIGAPVEKEITTEFENYALEVSKLQSHLFMPRNIRHFLCPPLEKYVEHNYAEFETKEEVPTEGTIVE